MKLIRLVNQAEYKNIPVGVFDFGEGGYTALVGANGSGKSNWIEVIAKVTLHLIEQKDVPKFSYKLELENESEVRFQGGQLKYFIHGIEVDRGAMDLPSKVMVCYSGEEQRLWSELFFKSYSRYFSSGEIRNVSEPPSLYVNRYHWAIAMIVLLCSEQQEVKELVEELWGLGIQPNRIRVDIKIADEVKGYTDPNTQSLLEMIQRESASEDGLYVSHFKSFTIAPGGQQPEEKCKLLYYLLYALSMPVVKKDNDIAIQKAIEKITLKRGDDDLELTGLSEGHKKRILIMLLTRILGDEKTVYLLDEPDAHVDVMTKKKIIDLISTAKGHTILTTHSPVMTSKMDSKSVRKVEKGMANTAAWDKVFTQLSGGEISSIEGFLFTLNKKIVITEGPYDIRYIHRAAELLKVANPDIEKVEDVPSYNINGTGAVKFFIEHTLNPIIGYFDKVLFLFDRDKAGRDGFAAVEKYINDNGLGAKVSALMYCEDFANEPAHDFLIEDFFPVSCYSGKGDVPDFSLMGTTPYYDLKKLNDVQAKVKGYIESHYKTADFDAAAYGKFLNLLRKIVEKLDL